MTSKKYNAHNTNCPSHKVLSIISDKWTILIIEKLSQKTYRFGELKQALHGVSQKVLTETLKTLERNGFILRESYPVLPLKVEYSLTPLGKNLSNVFISLTTWAETHIEEILAAEEKYLAK